MRPLVLALALVAPLSLTSTAQAGKTVHLVGVQLTHTGWGSGFDPLQVPAHDPALGTLRSVTLCFRGAVVRRFAVESLDQASSTVVLSGLSSAFLWRRPSDPTQVLALRRAEFPDLSFPLGAFDGALDFAGSSGADTLPLVRGIVPVDLLLEAPADLARFTPAGVGAGLVTVPLELRFGTLVSGPGNFVLEAEASAMLTGMVVYDWTPAGS